MTWPLPKVVLGSRWACAADAVALVYAAQEDQALGLPDFLKPKHWQQEFEGRSVQVSALEIGHAATLVLNGSGLAIERAIGAEPIYQGKHAETWQSLVRESLSKRLCNHYGGKFVAGCRRFWHEVETLGPPDRWDLHLRSLYRQVLTGLHALQAHEIICDVDRLARRYQVMHVPEQQKSDSAMEIPRAQDVRRELGLLAERLHQAGVGSSLPEASPNREAINDFVIAMRRL